MRNLVLMLSLFILSSSLAYAKKLIISDIDDTIKMTNNLGKLAQVKHFIDNDPFPVMPLLFQDLKTSLETTGEEVEFIYVSAGYHAIFNGDKFIKKNKFPEGKVHLRTLKSPTDTFTFKYLTISKIIENMSAEDRANLEVYFFGDTAGHDPEVYYQVTYDLKLKSHIFIRDVRTLAVIALEGETLQAAKGLNYYFTEKDLKKFDLAPLMGENSIKKIDELFNAKTILPKYVKTTLIQRVTKKFDCKAQDTLVDFVRCKKSAKKKANELIQEYYKSN